MRLEGSAWQTVAAAVITSLTHHWAQAAPTHPYLLQEPCQESLSLPIGFLEPLGPLSWLLAFCACFLAFQPP
jgi:hypothetical protein